MPPAGGLGSGLAGGAGDKPLPGVGGNGEVPNPIMINLKIYINLQAGGLGETVQGLGIDQILNLDLDNQKVRHTRNE